MNQVTDEQKASLTKVLAIVGFIAVIILGVWLAVQIVRVVPNAFSSLASLADSVYNYNRNNEIIVATEKTVFNAGESFTISWNDLKKDGEYSFAYECVEGTSVEVRINGEITPLSCDTPLSLANATSLEVRVSSEKNRFVDVPYTISFTETGKTEASLSKNATITIVNASIPASGIAETDTTPATDEEEKDDVVAPTKPTTPKTPTYVAGTPITTTKYVYTLPVSNPKGKVDLQVTFIGVGTLNGKTFVKESSIDVDDEGAVQFEIKNIGTKTAEDWSYEADLPAGINYSSPDQKPLKPNERALITLGFEGLSKTGSEKIGVEVDAKGDVKESNNEFSKTIKITD